jgi:hypothetical protein
MYYYEFIIFTKKLNNLNKINSTNLNKINKFKFYEQKIFS